MSDKAIISNWNGNVRYLKALICLLLPLAVPACAQYASEISPAPISDARYDGWSCAKLNKEQAFVDTSLVRVGADQDDAANRDAVMVFLIGVPTSGGGVKGQVADLKGQQIAIHNALRDHSCL
jgi:hypothetical protein